MKALITGASSGIGKEIALNLAERGIDLVLVGRNSERMYELEKRINGKVDVDIIQIDLSIIGSADELHRTIIEQGHLIDILVNNAGFGLFGKNNDFKTEMLEKMLVLNMITPTMLCRLFSVEMAQRGMGYILNVASTASFQPIPYFSSYAASKSYLRSFSKSLHYELKNKGVIVTCLSPGPTDTNFFEVALSGERFPLFKGKPLMSPHQVAEIGINALFNKKASVTAGMFNKIFRFILPAIPLSIVEKVLSRYN